MGTDNGSVGGGEILQYWEQNEKVVSDLEEQLIRMFQMLPYIKILIIALLTLAMVIIIIKIMHVRNPLKGRAVISELDYIDRLKRHDQNIVRMNHWMSLCTKIIEKTPWALNKAIIEYWDYNIRRANLKVPGGSRTFKPQEFNAIIKMCELFSIAFGAFIGLFMSSAIGTMWIIGSIFLFNLIPMMIVRQIVKEKDLEITSHFTDFYLMIHYVLLASAGTPISNIIKSYDKTTNSEEMHRFADVCIHNIDTYGEYEATRYISKNYMEISEVGKLMRLIRQANEGGDIRAELIGFRNELLAAKKYAITKRMEKIVAQAKASFNILMIILVQAIASAAAIYLKDLQGGLSLLG